MGCFLGQLSGESLLGDLLQPAVHWIVKIDTVGLLIIGGNQVYIGVIVEVYHYRIPGLADIAGADGVCGVDKTGGYLGIEGQNLVGIEIVVRGPAVIPLYPPQGVHRLDEILDVAAFWIGR